MDDDSPKPSTSNRWAQGYRDRWKWDKVTWGCHCVDCYPSNCPYRVYVKDGRVVREEQAGTFETIEAGVPDMNPAGCQKGAAWSEMLYGKERVLHPLRRTGERGEGQFEEISWDAALSEIADAMLDAIEESGAGSIVSLGTPGEGGTQTTNFARPVFSRLGVTSTDVQAEINDFNPGLYATFGRFDPVASNDDWFHSELLLIWANNPVYSAIPYYHYISESRYNGGEVVTIAPDFSPSAVHADYFLPVKIGSDAALALSMCRVIIDEGLMDTDFVREQTDLGLLVRRDTGRFLRASDLQADGSDEFFYLYDEARSEISPAPRTLDLKDLVPALEGRFDVTLEGGEVVQVEPVFERLRRTLDDYSPEDAAKICGTHPDSIKQLARKVAARRTRILLGWTTGKSYHGDLIERAMCLLLGLTGNWGKKGTGTRSWGVGMFDGPFTLDAKPRAGQDATRELVAGMDQMTKNLLAADPTLTQEILMAEFGYSGAASGGSVPPVFFWYHHCGYREVWNKGAANDPSMKRSFDEYLQEAIDEGWWSGTVRPPPDSPPRVLIEIGGNVLRRQRGGQRMLLENLWPKLKLIVSVDWRMTTTGLHSDIVLPAAQHHEKTNFPYTTPDVMNLTLADKAVEPAGEARSEWQITLALAKMLAQRAEARGLEEFEKPDGSRDRFDSLYDQISKFGVLDDDDAVIDEVVRDSVVMGTLPEGTTLASLREKGFVRFTGWGRSSMALAQASDLRPDETHSPFRWQTEKKEPFPTLTRRAQFYIDHPWFLEAGEELPVHKDAPSQGGDHPLEVTSGHPRWSANSMNSTSEIILQTIRGEPVAHINDGDAADRGIENGQDMRVFNDLASITVQARVTPAVQPGQLIMYNCFEPYQFKEWQDFSNVEPGMVKWLHLAGGYGHLRYRALHWQPVPIDRAVRVDVAPAEA
ncbi:MAG: molybdopterin-dependent oxidoreductase [Deltaproteobacteria bacterium]|nr:molybdopterin-dependent oxidoreductase [Deltaproteobacteria bacterium]